MDELIINGRFLCQRATGVQRASREFIMALDRLLARGEYAGLEVCLVAPNAADFIGLGLQRIQTRHVPGGAGYFWEQVALPLHVGRKTLACLGNAAPILSLLGPGQVTVMLHDQSYRLFPEDYGRAYRVAHSLMDYFILRRARPLCTVSHCEAAEIRRNNRAAPTRIIVAPNGSWIKDDAGTSIGQTAAITAARGNYVLYVGGFSERKNIARVFAATRALVDQGVAVRLVGYPNALSKAFQASLDSQSRARITFTGFVEDDVLAQLYQGAICLIYPSLYEASGLPPSEAMHLGCPVVVSDLPVLRERCGEAALYCDPANFQTIVDRVLDIVHEPALSAGLSERGKARSQQLTWENQARIIMDGAIA